jgi:hypothetical protein
VTFVLRENGECHYFEEDTISPLWKGKKFPMNTCISGWCMLNRRTAVIEDIYADPRIPHDVYRSTFVKSLMMVPVALDHPVAAIGAYWQEQHEFVEPEVKAMEALAFGVFSAWRRIQAA